MSTISSNLLRPGARVEDAMDIFRAAIEYNNLQKHTIHDWGEVYLPYLTDPEGWLGVWMLKSDEAAAFLFNARIWDAVYVRDAECVQVIRPVNSSDADVRQTTALESYEQFPLATDIGIPFSLRFKVANLALMNSLNFIGRSVQIKPVSGFYNIEKELADGDILPFQDRVRLGAHLLNQYIVELNSDAKLHNALQKEVNP